MWEAAGQRVSEQKHFHEKAPENIRELYQRHARGNALYRNQGNGQFENVSEQAGVEMGRWSWSLGFLGLRSRWLSRPLCCQWLYFRAGTETILRVSSGGRWWPNHLMTQRRRMRYERGWHAINELIRSDNTWNGYERNVMFANNRDGTFSEVSGPSGWTSLRTVAHLFSPISTTTGD